MKYSLPLISLVSCAALLSACDSISQDAYANRGDPENQIDVSTEVVNVSLSSNNALVKLSDSVAQDAPARAELQCSLKDTRCAQAKEIFEQHSVPVKFSTAGTNSVKLVYERVVVRDCDPRYRNNSRNEKNLNYSAFGCSVVGNTLQMVTDKREFTNPALTDVVEGSGGKAAQVYHGFLKAADSGSANGMRSATGAPPK